MGKSHPLAFGCLWKDRVHPPHPVDYGPGNLFPDKTNCWPQLMCRVLAIVGLLFTGSPGRCLGEPVQGVVYDEDGQPAVGAEVFAAAIFRSPPLRVRTLSDADGHFELDVPKLSGNGFYSLAVRHNDQGIDLWKVDDFNGKNVFMKGQPLPLVMIHLRRAGVLDGRLLQKEDGQPIAHAEIYLDTGDVLKTNERGEFHVGGLATSDHSLIPVAPGRARKYVLFDTTLQPRAALDVYLSRAATVRGKIVDEQCLPVANACLSRSASGTALTLNGWDQPGNPDGTFEYSGLTSPERNYQLNISAPGYQTAELNVQFSSLDEIVEKTVVLQPKPRQALDLINEVLKLPIPQESVQQLPRRAIDGMVKNQDGEPIVDAEVRWAAFLWDPSVKSVRTDAAGRFGLQNVPLKKGALLILAKGHAPKFTPLRDSSEEISVILSKGIIYRGRVLNSRNEPVAGVQVVPVTGCSESGYCNPIWLSERAVYSNAEGRFEIQSMMSSGVFFDILDRRYSEQRNVTLKPDVDNEVRLTAGGAIQGMVIDAGQNPVRNFNIRVTIPRHYEPGEEVGGHFAGFDWYGVDFTRDDGIFVLSDLTARSWSKLIVSAPEIGLATVDRVQAQPLDQLSSPQDLTIKLEPHQPLLVEVVDKETGKPIERASVGLIRDEIFTGRKFGWGYDDRSGQRFHTDQQGEVKFAEPSCGDGTLFISAPGYARTHLPWDGSSYQMTVPLESEARVKGAVRIGELPLHEGYVRVTCETEDYSGVNLAETQGDFEFPQLPSGECLIEVLGNNGEQLAKETISLKPGDLLELQLTVSKP